MDRFVAACRASRVLHALSARASLVEPLVCCGQLPVFRLTRLRGCLRSRMPVMNGDDATALLRQQGVTLPIVGITGDAQREDLESFARKGADEVSVRMPPS
jgi:hypothetical protein